MKKILIATHGHLASGMLNSIGLLTGTQEGITTIDAYSDETDFKFELSNFIDSLSSENQVFAFTDLFGGSVNQIITNTFLERQIPVTVISGFNFPIILEIVLSGEKLNDEQVSALIDKCRLEMKVNFLSEMDITSEEDFFI